MRVYIELVFLNNFAVTFLLAKLSYRILCVELSRLRIILGSLLGGAAALICPLITPLWALTLYRVSVGLAIGAVLFKPRKMVKGTLFFFLLTFLFGGAMFAVGYLVYGSAEKAMTLPVSDIPLCVGIAAVYALYVLIKRLITRLFKRRDVKNFVYSAEIRIFDKDIKCKAFLDSGNRLYDEISGLPVVIAGIKSLTNALSDEQMSGLLTGNTKEFNNGHYIDVGSVGGKSRMFVFRPDGLVVYQGDKKNIINDVMLGVAFKRLADAEGYGLILNPAIMIGE